MVVLDLQGISFHAVVKYRGPILRARIGRTTRRLKGWDDGKETKSNLGEGIRHTFHYLMHVIRIDHI